MRYPQAKMSDIETSTPKYVFPAELMRYFGKLQSGIKKDKPTGHDYIGSPNIFGDRG